MHSPGYVHKVGHAPACFGVSDFTLLRKGVHDIEVLCILIGKLYIYIMCHIKALPQLQLPHVAH